MANTVYNNPVKIEAAKLVDLMIETQGYAEVTLWIAVPGLNSFAKVDVKEFRKSVSASNGMIWYKSLKAYGRKNPKAVAMDYYILPAMNRE